jgi:hypothetical protein
MFFELQDEDARKAAHQLHARMIKAALIEIFQFPDGRAQKRVDDLLRHYDDAPARERDFFIHEDPVNLATQIAGKSKIEPQELDRRLKYYNEQVRPKFVDEARRQYETNVKPTLEKAGLEN